MAEKCSVCGTTMGRFDKPKPLLDEFPGVLVCAQCARHGDVVRVSGLSSDASEQYEYGISKRYFEQHLASCAMSDDARSAVNALIEGVQARKAAAQEQVDWKNEVERLADSGALDDVLSTTGNSFEGYVIVGYHGVVSASYVQGTGVMTDMLSEFSDLVGAKSDGLKSYVDIASRYSRRELLKQALLARGNAVIGVDLRPFVMSGNMIGMLATGTAVTVKKA